MVETMACVRVVPAITEVPYVPAGDLANAALPRSGFDLPAPGEGLADPFGPDPGPPRRTVRLQPRVYTY